jgi:hypothetical protein
MRALPVGRSGTLFCALGMLTVGACGDLDPASPPGTEEVSAPILGGSPVPAGVRREVGLVSTATGSCTATMITPRHFLTAAHCINFQGSTSGGSLSLEAAPNLPVDRIFSLGNNQLGQHDLAVGQLFNPVSSSVAVPANVGTSAPSFSTTITQVGFGCTNRQSGVGFGTKRFLTFTRGSNNDVGCPGDSGGPAFLGSLTGTGDLVLVASGYQTVFLGDDNDFYADPGLHRTEIFALTNALARDGICYRAHVGGIGWMPAVCNGAVAGTTGQSRDIQAIQIWSNRPGVSVCYNAHLAGIGWQGEVCDSAMAGTTGQSRSMEAIQVRLRSRSRGETLNYQAHVAGIGWMAPVAEGQTAGTTGQSRGLQALTLTMTP